MKIETLAIHHGQKTDSATGSVTSPIYLSTTYERQADGTYPQGFEYARGENPNRNALESCVAALENGIEGAAFSSGSAAAMTLFQALSPGDHIIAPIDLYYGVREMIKEVFMPIGIEATFVDMTENEQVEKAVQPNTKLIIVETPSNPLLTVADIAALAEIAQKANAYLAVDNTIGTPVLCRPLDMGADFVIHATTKYIGGHSDILGGMIVAKEENELWEKIKFLQKRVGAVPSPFECWLALRGIHSLPYRVRAQAAHAMKIAQFLDSHPKVEQVLYPGLKQHPQHAIAKKQMSAFGGLMSFLVKGGEQAAMEVAARVKIITRATSFGGTHSLIEHRASIEAPGSTTPRNLLRLSIGLENVEDLIGDLDNALRW